MDSECLHSKWLVNFFLDHSRKKSGFSPLSPPTLPPFVSFSVHLWPHPSIYMNMHTVAACTKARGGGGDRRGVDSGNCRVSNCINQRRRTKNTFTFTEKRMRGTERKHAQREWITVIESTLRLLCSRNVFRVSGQRNVT